MAFDLSPAHRIVPHCEACPASGCLARLDPPTGSWREMVGQSGPQMPGINQLMVVGEPLSALFAVRAGCIKSFTIDAQGYEHIRAFHFPGDLVGLEALGSAQAQASAEPVTLSQVCAVPTATLLARFAVDPGLAGTILDRTQRDLRQALGLTAEYPADQRVAAFLLYVNARIGNQGVVRLPMTRREIGSYLRLATETVCRMLSRFEKKGWIALQEKRITLLRPEALAELSEPIGLTSVPVPRPRTARLGHPGTA